MMNKILALVDNSVISPYFLKHLINALLSSLISLLNKEANSLSPNLHKGPLWSSTFKRPNYLRNSETRRLKSKPLLMGIFMNCPSTSLRHALNQKVS